MEYLSKILMEQRAMSEIFELKDLVRSGEIRFKMNETFLSNDYSFDEVEFHIMTYYSGNKDHWLAFDSGKKRSVRLTKRNRERQREKVRRSPASRRFTFYHIDRRTREFFSFEQQKKKCSLTSN